MLESLETIDWQNLHHAYGPANDVPDLIRALTSNNQEVRQLAIYELHSNIWHQDTIYEATAYTAPFLIELLENDSIQNKDDILRLLASLATANSSQAVYLKQTRDAVASGIKTYITLLDNIDSEVRICALYTMACLSECRPEVLPILERCLESERNQQVRASLFLCIGSFSADQLLVYNHLFKRSMQAKREAPLVKLAAALALIKSTKDDHTLSPKAMQIIIEAIMHPEAIAPAYEALPWMHSDFIADMSMTICNLSPATASSVLSLCLEALTQASSYSIIDVISTMLIFAFDSITFGFVPASKGPTGHYLIITQRTILAALVECDQLWQNNVHIASIIQEGDIPGGREQLYACLKNFPNA